MRASPASSPTPFWGADFLRGQLEFLWSRDKYAPALPAAMVVTTVQLVILRHQKPKLFKLDEPTVEEAMMAVASLGGHIKQNVPPDWLVLMRGMERLGDLDRG